MKNFVRFLMVGFVALLLNGCMDVESLIKVKADGSGTIEQTVLMGSGLVDMMKGMGDAMGDDSDGSKTGGSPLIDKEKLAAAAKKMGEGVSFVGVVEHKTDTGEGYIATYAFTDINNIKLDQNPGSNAPTGGEDDEKTEPLIFVFKKGKTSTLTIKSYTGNKSKKDEKSATESTDNAAAEDEAADEMAMAMMKQMFSDMRVAMVVEIEGDIIETNATYRKDNRITIMDMDFGELLADEEAFKKFTKSKDQSIENAKKYMKDIPGIKMDMNDELVIKFK